MKYAEIDQQKELHKTAKKILNCILEAKRRIEQNEEQIRFFEAHFFYTKQHCLKNIESLNNAILRLEQRYAKIISQL